MPAPNPYPPILPPFALMVSNNFLTDRLRKMLNQNRKITFNVPMSLMVHFAEDPARFLQEPYIKWWTSHSTPMTAGYTVFDQKLNSEIEHDIETALVSNGITRRGVRHNHSIYDGIVNNSNSHKVKFRVSLSSVELTKEAQREGQLVESLAVDHLYCWSPIACVVLAVNDLICATDQTQKCHLASILVVALTIWHYETPRLTFDERKAEWNKTISLLTAGSSSLLKGSFDDDFRRVCTDVAAVGDDNFLGFDDEIEMDYGGPDGGHISAAFEEVRSYTVRITAIGLSTLRSKANETN